MSGYYTITELVHDDNFFQCFFLGIKPPSSGSRCLKYGRLPVWFRPSEVWVSCQFGSDQGRGDTLDPLLWRLSICPFQKSFRILCCKGEICVANFRPPATVANLGYYIFGYLHDFGQMGGLPISPKGTNMKISQLFLIQNPNLKGGSV